MSSTAMQDTQAEFAPAASAESRADVFSVTRREVATVVVFWLLFAFVTFANRALDPRRQSIADTNWVGTMSVSLVQALLWALFTLPIFVLVTHYVTKRDHRLLRAFLIVMGMVFAAVVVSAVVDVVRDVVLPIANRGRGAGRIPNEQPWWSFGVGGFQFINDIVIAMGVVAAGFARAFSLSNRARVQQATLLQAQLAEAKLEALRRQLDPHFLFNTLHAVSSLVERDPRGVRRMISRLSELLRHSIEGASDSEVTLRKELELLQRYVEIMQIRFQGRLTVQVHVPPEVLDALVPNMVLQPLVENAVKHGIESLTSPGHIDIRGAHEAGTLVLRVCDNGVGLTPSVSSGAALSRSGAASGGVGLRNIVARLEQLYGSEQAFALSRDSAGVTVAEVRLPFHTTSDLRTAGLQSTDLGG